MNELDEQYKMLLSVGFIVLREALDSGNTDWVSAEIEMLHNVPSLIGEAKISRHEYYWEKERAAYIGRTSRNGSALLLMNAFYQPIWESIRKEIECLKKKSGLGFNPSDR